MGVTSKPSVKISSQPNVRRKRKAIAKVGLHRFRLEAQGQQSINWTQTHRPQGAVCADFTSLTGDRPW